MGHGEPRRGEGLIFFRSALRRRRPSPRATSRSWPCASSTGGYLLLYPVDHEAGPDCICLNRLHSHTKNRSWLNSVFSKRALQWTSPSNLTVL